MYNILIIEDCEIQRCRLKEIISSVHKDINFFHASTLQEVQKIINENNIHLFFVDIHLGDESGLCIAREVRKIEKYSFVWIVFITSFQTFMIEAFKTIHCYDYIVKPYKTDEIIALTKKLLNCPQTIKVVEKQFFHFDINSVSIKIFFKDIIFIESQKKDCIVHTEYGIFHVKRIALMDLVSQSCQSILKQSHRSYIVNTEKISKIVRGNTWEIHFQGYEPCALIGSTFQKEFKLFIKEWC